MSETSATSLVNVNDTPTEASGKALKPVQTQPPAEFGLLTDDQGKRSMMRLMSFLALTASIWFAWMTMTDGVDGSNEGVYITTAFLLAAFAPKALQKFIENSYPSKKGQ